MHSFQQDLITRCQLSCFYLSDLPLEKKEKKKKKSPPKMLFCEQERAPLTDGSDAKTRSKPFLTITAFNF